MSDDSDYFSRRAAQARSAAFHKDDSEGVEVAGHLALAYSALARRKRQEAQPSEPPVDASEGLLLRP